jgi:DNA-binding LacI/PurR family transcriptional regulator
MTLREVARRARVSPATVSRVLNDTAVVKASTRARVEKAIKELKYSPNLHARVLAGARSRSLGVIVSNIENPFFLDVYKAVETAARAGGYEVILANTDYSSERLISSIRMLAGHRLAGLAAIVSEMSAALLQELSSQQIPIVFYGIGTPHRNVTNIRVDYRAGMDKLAAYLYSLGHRRIACLGHHATLGPIRERLQAISAAAGRYKDLVVETEADADTLEGGRRAARAVLDRVPGVTALVCINDVMAVGALRELRRRGCRVPDDVSVTGFDNVAIAQFTVPALTTMHVPRDAIGRTIAERLMSDEVPAAAREFIIEPELVVRDSTGPAR